MRTRRSSVSRSSWRYVDSNRAEILDAFSARLQNDYDLEFETALEEIHKIARLRLEAMEGNA